MGPVQQLLLKHLSWLIISPVFKKSILSTSGVGSILPLEDTSTAGISILPTSSLPPTAYPRSQVKLCPELLAQMHWAAPCISFFNLANRAEMSYRQQCLCLVVFCYQTVLH